MNRTLMFLVAALAAMALGLHSNTAEAKSFGYVQGSVQAQHGGTWMPVLDGSIGWTVPQTKDQLGFLAYTWIQPDWAQLYFGPAYNPSWAPWLTVGFHIGAQMTWGTAGYDANGVSFRNPDGITDAPKPNFSMRYAVSVQVHVDRFAFLGFVEFENKSFEGNNIRLRYDLTVRYGIVSIIKAEASGDNTYFNLNVGLKAHRFCGIGPILEFQIPVAYMTVWVNWTPMEPEGWQIAAVEGDKWNPSRFWTGLSFGF